MWCKTGLHTHKGAQGQAGKPKFWTQRIAKAVWAPARAVLEGQVWCPFWGVNRSTFWTEGGHCLGIWDTCRRRAFQGRTRLTTGCLGEEEKAGKAVDLGDLGRDKHGKIKGYGYKKGQQHVSSVWPVCLWLCPAPDQHSLACLVTKVHF